MNGENYNTALIIFAIVAAFGLVMAIVAEVLPQANARGRGTGGGGGRILHNPCTGGPAFEHVRHCPS
jgi:hypothetical protein